MNAPITWHLDPTVWQRAFHGNHEALIWWTGPGQQLGWCIYETGALDTACKGTGRNEADAKAQAEAIMRLFAAGQTGGNDHSSCRCCDPGGPEAGSAEPPPSRRRGRRVR